MPDSHRVTPALENYLEAIYILQKVKDPVRVNDIAEYLDVKMPSVTYNMKKLAEKNLIRYKKRSHVELTGEGEQVARSVHRAHEELFKFFHYILGVEKERAEMEACTVEHSISRDTLERLIRFTHWVDEVPSEHAMRPAAAEVCGIETTGNRLSDMPVGAKVAIKKLHSTGELRKRLTEMGLNRGTPVEIVRVAPLGDPIEVRIKGFFLSLRLCEAAEIEVEPAEEPQEAENKV